MRGHVDAVLSPHQGDMLKSMQEFPCSGMSCDLLSLSGRHTYQDVAVSSPVCGAPPHGMRNGMERNRMWA